MAPHGEQAALTGRHETARSERLRLSFACDAEGETFIAEQYAAYPFHICRPHRYADDPEGMATVTLQSLSGGIYQDERLSLSLTAAPDAKFHATNQASTIVHSMDRGSAEHSVTLVAGRDSLLEYLPCSTILFPRARYLSRIRVVADPTACVFLCDSLLSHDPEGQGGCFDWLLSDIAITDPGQRLRAREHYRVTGQCFQAAASVEFGGKGAQGSFFAITRAPSRDAMLDVLREALEPLPGLYAGVSTLPGDSGAWARVLAADGAALNAAMVACWRAARRSVTGVAPRVRRR